LGNFDEKYLANSPLGKIFDQAKQTMTSGQTPDSAITSQYPDAKKAPDGSWYVQRNGQWHPIVAQP
jgi:hypothetical protein